MAVGPCAYPGIGGTDQHMQKLDQINVAEVLDRVLDHGIVVDPSTRIFLLGIDLCSIKARFVVESVQTFL
jgi:gas vesicle protein GvpA/GvpJ/GvpM family